MNEASCPTLQPKTRLRYDRQRDAFVLLWPERGLLRYVIVGNVSGRVVSAMAERGLVSTSGTLGIQPVPPKTAVTECPLPEDAALVLWTDGLTSRLELSSRADLRRQDPAVVAATLHREHSRERDDATVVVVRGRDRP